MLWKRGCVLGLQVCGLGLGVCGLGPGLGGCGLGLGGSGLVNITDNIWLSALGLLQSGLK